MDFARNLQHTPGNLGNASYFADVAESLASRYEKLSVSIMGKEELLQAVLSEFEVDEETASRDLDELLEKFAGLGIIED